ncbi:hypothetical protein FEM41_15870 [Jejubacter calystegiae]|uniref:Uncharacterized protein n=1 Tax=Jejubacter calystegiae TaxID=2579935 RepID=A0A4P8YS49_9ENTR|nr:hypothetical protein FEM41_15870 [Jejubacter calystegiae]
MTVWGVRLFKVAYFLLIGAAIGRSLGPPDVYINYTLADKVCGFLFDDINAETIYDTYFYMDVIVVLTLTTTIYLLTVKLFNKIRNQ